MYKHAFYWFINLYKVKKCLKKLDNKISEIIIAVENVIFLEFNLILPGWIFLNNCGNMSTKNTPASIAIENHIIKKCSPARRYAIDIIETNTAGKIQRGKAFFCIFLILNKPKRNNGMPIIAKK